MRPHLKVFAVHAFAVLGAEDGGLEALAVLLEAEGLLAVAALVVARHRRVCIVLRPTREGSGPKWGEFQDIPSFSSAPPLPLHCATPVTGTGQLTRRDWRTFSQKHGHKAFIHPAAPCHAMNWNACDHL